MPAKKKPVSVKRALTIAALAETAFAMDRIAMKQGVPEGDLLDHLLANAVRTLGAGAEQVAKEYIKIRRKIRQELLQEMEAQGWNKPPATVEEAHHE